MSGFEDSPEVAAFLGFANSWGGYFVQVLVAPVGLIIGAFLAAGIDPKTVTLDELLSYNTEL